MSVQLTADHLATARKCALATAHRYTTPNGFEAEDIVQVGFEAAVRAAKSFDQTRSGPFDGWLCFRVRNAVLDELRKLGWGTRNGKTNTYTPLQRVDTDVDSVAVDDKSFELTATRGWLEAQLAKRTPVCRAVVGMHLCGYTTKEIAAELDVTERMAYHHVRNAMVHAREEAAA